MTPTRRVFLEVIGIGTAASALHAGCDRVVRGGLSGSGGASGTGGGQTGTGGTGTGGTGSGGEAAPSDAGDLGLGPDDLIGADLSELPVGAIVQVPGESIAVARDDAGVYAITLICTHLGCAMAPSGTGAAIRIDCPCHGSRFDGNGGVIRGPAAQPLAHLGVAIDGDGNVIVHTTTIVAASARVAV